MRDEDRRRLTRSDWLQDRARLLAERVRQGELTYERVEWAARLGHEEALAVVGKLDRSEIDWASHFDRGYAIRSVAEAVAGREFKRTVVAYAVDCAARALPLFEAKSADDRPRKALVAAQRWVANPTEASARRAHRAGIKALAAIHDDPALASLPRSQERLSAAVFSACVAALAPSSGLDKVSRQIAEQSLKGLVRSEVEWLRLRLAAYALGEVGPEGFPA